MSCKKLDIKINSLARLEESLQDYEGAASDLGLSEMQIADEIEEVCQRVGINVEVSLRSDPELLKDIASPGVQSVINDLVKYQKGLMSCGHEIGDLIGGSGPNDITMCAPCMINRMKRREARALEEKVAADTRIVNDIDFHLVMANLVKRLSPGQDAELFTFDEIVAVCIELKVCGIEGNESESDTRKLLGGFLHRHGGWIWKSPESELFRFGRRGSKNWRRYEVCRVALSEAVS